jgi:Tfp pilus assembly protein PilZ
MMEKRRNHRMDKAFPVSIRSENFGECCTVARNISAGGIMVEVTDPLPLGTEVQVFFSMPESPTRIVARGEVKNHYFLNFADPSAKGATKALTGMGVRFTAFESEEDLLAGFGISRLRTLLH